MNKKGLLSSPQAQGGERIVTRSICNNNSCHETASDLLSVNRYVITLWVYACARHVYVLTMARELG